jgi:hypothetical protein
MKFLALVQRSCEDEVMATRLQVTVNFKGKKFVGEDETAGRALRVFFEGKSKVGMIKGPNAEFFASLLLIELLSGV